MLALLALGLAAAALALTIGTGSIEIADALPYIVSSSALAFLLAVALPIAVTRTPQRALVARSLIPWATLFAILTLLVAVLTRMLALSAPVWAGSAAGLALSLPLMLATVMLWFLPLRAVYELGDELADPARRDAAIRKIHTMTANVCSGTGYVDRRLARSIVIASAGLLAEARLFRDTLDVIARLRDPAIPRPILGALHGVRAVAHAYVGEHAEAERAIESALATSPAEPLKSSLPTLRALVLAISGRAEEARELLASIVEPKNPRLRRGWLLAQANVAAASADEPAAGRYLDALAVEHPADGLERAIALGGPAAALAKLRR